MKNKSVAQWTDYIQTLHKREIELSLERVRHVYQQMYPEGVSYQVVCVAGTNGKGSTAELIASIYRSEYSVGKYTSPHLLKFNERINVDGQSVSDAGLIAGMERVEQARGDVSLTFFEFGTLVAIDLFEQASVDLAVMEVGLGGRLDAVNILEPSVSVVTNISIDHVAWLGNTVEQIGAEKIAISRPNKPCILGMSSPPASILEYVESNKVSMQRLGIDFEATLSDRGDAWHWQTEKQCFNNLPLPFGQSNHQLNNAAVAIAAVDALQPYLPLPGESEGRRDPSNSELSITEPFEQILVKGIANAHLEGRCQLIQQHPPIIVDVAHNEASVLELRKFLDSKKINGKVIAVCGMLADKNIGAALAQMFDLVDHWHFVTISGERGSTAEQVQSKLLQHLQQPLQRPSQSESDTLAEQQFDEQAGSNLISESTDQNALLSADLHPHAVAAFEHAKSELRLDDCLVVFGSFYIVSDIIAAL